MRDIYSLIFRLLGVLCIPFLLLGLAYFCRNSEHRDYVHVVGSSTVFPFSALIAEHFTRASEYGSPLVEINGTGLGLKLFCAGVGYDSPDVANASRRIKDQEREICRSNGVEDIREILLGHDGVVIAQARDLAPLELRLSELFLALAARVPLAGKLVDNPYRTWQDINSDLPARSIQVLGPAATSGTYDILIELAIREGALSLPAMRAIKAQDPELFERLTSTLRDDGGYIEAGENDNIVIQKLRLQPELIGVIGFSFYEKNCNELHATRIEGKLPSLASLSNYTYPLSRPLYVYLKTQHYSLVAGLESFAAELEHARRGGAEGYLAREGMVPAEQSAVEKVGASCSP